MLAIVKRKKQELERVLNIVNSLTRGADVDDLLQIAEQPEESTSHVDIAVATKKEKIPKPSKPKPQKGDSHRMTLELFRQNKSIAEIALLRGLTYGTVENHLITFIATGDISVDEIVPTQKLDSIIQVINEAGPSSLTAVKERLGNDYSYGEIRAVFRHLERIAEPRE